MKKNIFFLLFFISAFNSQAKAVNISSLGDYSLGIYGMTWGIKGAYNNSGYVKSWVKSKIKKILERGEADSNQNVSITVNVRDSAAIRQNQIKKQRKEELFNFFSYSVITILSCKFLYKTWCLENNIGLLFYKLKNFFAQ
jgi:hypothetical protein